MPKKFSYSTILISGPMKGVYAEFPFDSRKEFGTKKHVWCKVTVEGKTYSMNLLPNGKDGHWLHLKKDIRDAIGKHEGDTVQIELEQDTRPQKVDVPDYLQWLLDNDEQMAKYFEKLNISAKKFWVAYIEGTKNEDTKVDRINSFFEFLHRHYSEKV
ncbi:MAG TPA: YdeI/OmpD-associated family protein [Draconibacterium sp.]|nr:YdeI/OmpD-associated family protein [Draconibacterium sp.]